jgi:paraquat-inducible protein B
MSQNVNKKAIGLFMLGGTLLLITAIILLGSSNLFKVTYKYILYFDGSVKGLSVGAPVTFRGVNIGKVKEMGLVYDPQTKKVLLPVIIAIEQKIKGASNLGDSKSDDEMINLGLRAKLELQNFLTGQLMVTFDFYPDKPIKLTGFQSQYKELPTLDVNNDPFETINQIPLKSIAMHLDDTIKGINGLLNSNQVQTNLDELRSALQEVKEATRSIRYLSDYLEQHPESLLKGKIGTKGE